MDQPKVKRTELSALVYSNGFTLWHYRTEHASQEVCKPHYFADAANQLRNGDFVIVNAANRPSDHGSVCDSFIGVLGRDEHGGPRLRPLTELDPS